MKAGGWTRQTLGWVLAALTLLGAMGASGWHLWPEARANALAMQPLAQVPNQLQDLPGLAVVTDLRHPGPDQLPVVVR